MVNFTFQFVLQYVPFVFKLQELNIKRKESLKVSIKDIIFIDCHLNEATQNLYKPHVPLETAV